MKPQLLNYIEVLVSNQCSGASMCRGILKDATCPLIKITAKCVMVADTILAKGRGRLKSSANEATVAGNHGLCRERPFSKLL